MAEGTGSFQVCGKAWTVKVFIRFLVCIILFNALLAVCYFFGAYSIQPAHVLKQPHIGVSREHVFAANLMSHMVADDSSRINRVRIDESNDLEDPWEENGEGGEYGDGEEGGQDDRQLQSDRISQLNQGAGKPEVEGQLSKERTRHFKTFKVDNGDSGNAKDENQPPSQTDEDPDYVDADQDKQGGIETSSEGDVEHETPDKNKEVYPVFPVRSEHQEEKRKDPVEKLEDTEHPQFSMAFPKHNKPLHLLNWTRSNESRLHFPPIDEREAWLYSAFYDNRLDSMLVRVFGITNRHLTGPVLCYLLDQKGEQLKRLRGYMRLMKDSHGSNYSAMEVSCPLETGLQPFFVMITFPDSSSPPTNRITIQYRGPQTRNFTVCFPPLHSNYSLKFQLVQTIELNTVLGANHFVVYNFSMSSEVGEILRGYQSEGLVTILPWPLPVVDSWYYGQMLAINDCIYRNMGTSRFVVVTDTDEVIVPHIHSSWMTLLSNVVEHPWQRDDEFQDPDLSPGSEYYRIGISDGEDGREVKEEGGKKKKKKKKKDKKKKKRDDKNKDSLQQNTNDLADGDGPGKKLKYTRNSDTFPSRSLGARKSRNLLTLEPDVEKNNISASDNLRFGSFSFRCAFFTAKKSLTREQVRDMQAFTFTQQEKELFSQMPRCPMVHLMRRDTIFEHGLRSKVIVQPEYIISSGIHKVIAHLAGYRGAYVEPEVAILHHYRDYKLYSCNTLDTSVLSFKEKFYQHLKSASDKYSTRLLSRHS